jgi:prevent-host-death family protein
MMMTGHKEMTMNEEQTTISASEFKAKCLDLLDQLNERKLTRLVITKRGRPVAVLTPAEAEADVRDLFGCMRGRAIVPVDLDLTAPVLDEPLSALGGHIHE